ncbi:MAG: FAD-binding oxidoreductase, partial [Sphingomonadales bacterium]|nr:FAD-binding oxidoreductase [Sphingomonadales bacterium]
MSCADFVIIGGGIAGASVAYRLAPHGSVVLLEREVQPGMHATGRSAAFFAESYGGPQVMPLTMASRRFFESPPEGFSDVSLMTPRGAIYIARADQMDSLERMLATYNGAIGGLKRLSGHEVLAKIEILRPDYVAGGLFEPGCRDLDVAALHQGFLRGLKAAGGELMLDAEVRELS